MAASVCLECKEKVCLKTGKPCKEVEKILKQETIGRRNWLTYLPTDKLERTASLKAFRSVYGKRYKNQPEIDD